MDANTREKTATFKKFIGPVNEARRLFSEIREDGDDVTFEQLHKLSLLTLTAAPDEWKMPTATIFSQGLDELEKLSTNNPSLSKEIRHAGLLLVLGAFQVGTLPAGFRMDREQKMITPLMAKNNAKSEIIARAKKMASEQWKLDTDKKIKTGAMADMVWSLLIDAGLSEHLPDNVARIRTWIRDVAPEYAKAKGRPKNASRNG